MTAADVVIVLLGVVAVGSGVLVVTTRQLVHAALWLVVSFGALAASYVVLAAEFVAWVQVLIYVGAVVVLLLFGIMLTRAPIGRSDDLDSGNRLVALVVARGHRRGAGHHARTRLPHRVLPAEGPRRQRFHRRARRQPVPHLGAARSRRCRCCCWPR